MEQLDSAVLPSHYQPIPITIIDEFNDTLFHSYKSHVCSNTKDLINKHKKSDLYVDFEKNVSDILDDLAKAVNRSSLTVKDVTTLALDLNCEVYDGRPSPVEFNSTLGKKMTLLHNFFALYVLFGSDSLVKLGATPLASEILKHFDSSIHNETQLKLVYYSGHENNIISLMRTLNLSKWQCILDSLREDRLMSDYPNCEPTPEFASSMNFELFEERGEYFVKLIYNGKEMELCQSSDGFCSVEEFTAKMRNGIAGDFDSLCGQEILVSVNENGNDKWEDPLIVFLYASCIMSIALFCYDCQKKSEDLRKSNEYMPLPYHEDLNHV